VSTLELMLQEILFKKAAFEDKWPGVVIRNSLFPSLKELADLLISQRK
jgi:hypothetical protein